MDEKYKYLENGQAVVVCEVLKSGDYLVSLIFCENETGSEYISDEYQVVSRIFDSPPTALLDETVEELKVSISKLRQEKYELEHEIRLHNKRVETISKIKGLEPIADYLDGKITHYVIFREYYGKPVEIINQFREGRKIDRIPFFRPSDDNGLDWIIQEDQRHDKVKCIPCVSREKAISIVQEWLNSDEATKYNPDDIVCIAKEYKLSVKPEIIEASREKRRKYLRGEVNRKQEELKRVTKDLGEYQSKLDNLG